MKYYLASNDLYIEILASVFNQIQLQAESEYPNENGGMLAGRYSTDRRTVYIEKIVMPIEKVTGSIIAKTKRAYFKNEKYIFRDFSILFAAA